MDRTSATNSEDGLYTDLDVSTGVAGTAIRAADKNAIQEELMNVIENADLTPDSDNWTQLLQGIRREIRKAVIPINDTWKNIYTFDSSIEVALCGGVDTFFVGPHDKNIYQSTDNGESWKTVATLDSYATAMAYANDIILVGTYSGSIWRSSDNGDSWEKVYSDFSKRIYKFAYTEDGWIVGGNLSGILYKSTDDGESWDTVLDLEDDDAYFPIVIYGGGIAIAGSSNGIIYKSADNGDSWSKIQQLSSYRFYDGYYHNGVFVVSMSDATIWRSTDDGESWDNTLSADNKIKTLSQGNGTAFAGETSTYALYKSTDDGESWEKVATLDGSISAQAYSNGVFLLIAGGKLVYRPFLPDNLKDI
ncbi:MAG: hypothetical protein PQJ46_09475 [Spirochaetales bacterium]|nr:hypothetical protein [Spirochaetales bacterium]